jgi:hypothetical protein
MFYIYVMTNRSKHVAVLNTSELSCIDYFLRNHQATGWTDRVAYPSMDRRFFSHPNVLPFFGGWGGCPPGLLFNDQRVFFPGVKGSPGQEVNQLSASGTKVNNEWGYTCASPICFHGADRENFALLLFLFTYFLFFYLFFFCFSSRHVSLLSLYLVSSLIRLI